MQFTVEKVDEIMGFTVFHNVLVILFSGTMKSAHAEHVSRRIEELLAIHPRGVVVASMTAASLPAPALEVRREINAIFNRFGERMLLAMPIVDDRGIFAAARRAFFRGVILFLGQRNLTIAASLDEALRLASPLAKRSDGTPVPERELAGLLRFCAGYLASDEAYSRLS